MARDRRILPLPLLSILTWLPMLAGWTVLLVMDMWNFLELQDGGPRAVEHRATQTHVDWAGRLNRASWVSLVVLVLVVTVAQHVGIARDHRDLARAEDEDLRSGVHRRGVLDPAAG